MVDMVDWLIGFTVLSLLMGTLLVGFGLVALVVVSLVASLIAKAWRGLKHHA